MPFCQGVRAEKLLPNCKFATRVLTAVRRRAGRRISVGHLLRNPPQIPRKTPSATPKTFETAVMAPAGGLYPVQKQLLFSTGATGAARPVQKPSSAAQRLFRRALSGRLPVARLAQKLPSGAAPDLCSPPFRPVGATIGRPLFKQKDNERQNQNLFSGTRATDSRPYKNRRRSIVSPPVPNRRRNHKHRAAAPFTRAGARCTHL